MQWYICDSFKVRQLLAPVSFNAMAQPDSRPTRRLVYRISTLAVIGIVATFLQKGYERDGEIWMLFMELLAYFLGVILFFGTQTGRLKSGPDTGKISAQDLFEYDPAAKSYIAIYCFVFMLFVVAYAFLGNDIATEMLGPWNIFISVAPIALIIFVRQYRLERRRKAQ